MTPRGVGWAALAIAAIASSAAAGPATRPEAPPANLVSGDATHGAALDPVFAHFQLARLACTFREEKHIALLAKPLRSSGTIYYDRDKGVARTTTAPKPERVVVTRTTLRFRKGDHTEEVPLDKSKDLKAFALIFPGVLRGDRGELERSFDIGLYGSDAAWWALAFTPKTDSLRALVRRVVVFGHKAELVALQVVEASGDTTDTQLSELRTNGAVPDAEIASAFGAP
ncbi:MAG TPA: outer membrane lipoprotein carrier protein LolA [Kofleriaceae bacterium]|jgi:outer membrane lipoprotein-sorting protein